MHIESYAAEGYLTIQKCFHFNIYFILNHVEWYFHYWRTLQNTSGRLEGEKLGTHEFCDFEIEIKLKIDANAIL